jgi:hypothetical protein
MKTALERYELAANCEVDAANAPDDASRTALLETAKHWRKLGELAKEMEASEAQALRARP